MIGSLSRVALAVCIAAAFVAPALAAPAPELRIGQTMFAGELAVPLNKSHVVEVDSPFKRISIGNPEIADILPLTSRSFYVLGKKLGVTNLTLFDSRERVLTVIDVTVTYDITGLKTRLSELFANDKIEVRATSDGIVLSGAAAGGERVNQIAKLANSYAPGKVTNLMSASGSQQVMLAVRFVEVNRQLGRALGLRTNATTDGFSFSSFDPTTIIDALATSFGVAEGSFGLGEFTIDMFLEAIERKGSGRSLAEPNLVALSGDTASFLAGGEFPIPVAQDVAATGGGGGNAAITVEFKQFGVGLSFTPTVLDEGRINLVVKPEVSTIDSTTAPIELSGFAIPGLKTSRVETTIELRDGQSFAIAGLYQDNFSDNVDQLPWIGDVPVLGSLFRSSSFLSRQTELVVIVTAYLVKPTLMANLSTPADRFIPPSDLDLFFGGRTEGGGIPLVDEQHAATTLQVADRPGGLSGAHGYILE
jgi:pilus assembly protein CpaC